MVKIDVREVGAGLRLDKAVARLRGESGYYIRELCYEYHAKTVITREPKPVSTDIAEAWELVETMTGENAWMIEIQAEDGYYLCTVYEPDELFAHSWVELSANWSSTIPLAICRAFILAHGITEIEAE